MSYSLARLDSARYAVACLGVARRGFHIFFVCASLFLISACTKAFAAEEEMGRRCVMCHITGSAEIMAGEETFYVPSGIDREQGSETMCYSCHNGSVMDSRSSIWTGHQHATGATAGPGVKIPKGFPLTEDKKLFCGTCHSPHEADIEIEGRIVSNMRQSAGSDDFCVKCHVAQEKGGHLLGELETAIPMTMTISGGLAGEKKNKLSCRTCHLPHGAAGKEMLVRSKDAVCEDCHGQNPSKEGDGPGMESHPVGVEIAKKSLRKRLPDGTKLSAGQDGEVICLTCHKAHNPRVTRSLLVADNAAGKLCVHCHDDYRGEGAKKDNNGNHPFVARSGRGRKASQGCNICHRTHNGASDPFADPGKSHVLTASMADSELCVKCHEDMAAFGSDEARAKGTHPLGVWADVRKSNAPDGYPVTERERISCRACHLSHGAEPGFSSLKEHGSFSCLPCHPNQNSLDERTSPPGNHPIYVEPDTGSIPEEFTLAGGFAGEYGEIICRTCHGVHNAMKDTQLLLEPAAEKDYCLTCHREKTLLLGTGHDLGVSSPDTLNKFAESREDSGACGVCHRTHGWARDKGDGPDAISRMCSDCHYDGSAIADPVGSHSHPIAAGMRGKNNLFGLPLFLTDGASGVSGDVTCATCHDVHRETLPRLTRGTDASDREPREESEENFLRLPYRGTDLLCLNCHDEKASLGGTPHDLSGTKGAGSAAGGACANCHSPHNGTGKMMWAMDTGGSDTGESDALMTTLCVSCHSTAGVAPKKLPGYSHPTDVSIPPSMDSGLPLYDSQGLENPFGLMTCATCHDTHGETAPGADFLRKIPARDQDLKTGRTDDHASALCVHCHEEQQSVFDTAHDLHKGICGGCHAPHSDAAALMLTDGAIEGADAVSQACMGCHASTMRDGKRMGDTNNHPVGVTPKTGAVGGLPLFDELGARQPQGMVTCATCHDPHTENPASEAAASAGSKKFQRVAGPSDRLCIKCHPKKANIIDTVHDPTNTPGDKSKSVCGACHAVHYAEGEPALWAAEYGVGEDLPSRYCLGCHDKEGTAKDKIPKHLRHPKTKVPTTERAIVESGGDKSFGNILKDMIVGPNQSTRGSKTVYVTRTMKLVDTLSMSKKEPPLLPLYDDEGRPGSSGILSCPSCHDIHNSEVKIREAIFKDDADRAKLENNLIRTNFLNEASRLCGECHGPYRLSVFWGFHGEARGKDHGRPVYRRKPAPASRVRDSRR